MNIRYRIDPFLILTWQRLLESLVLLFVAALIFAATATIGSLLQLSLANTAITSSVLAAATLVVIHVKRFEGAAKIHSLYWSRSENARLTKLTAKLDQKIRTEMVEVKKLTIQSVRLIADAQKKQRKDIEQKAKSVLAQMQPLQIELDDIQRTNQQITTDLSQHKQAVAAAISHMQQTSSLNQMYLSLSDVILTQKQRLEAALASMTVLQTSSTAQHNRLGQLETAL